jgi:RNA polymerase sigma-70 factor, ECF subfamily
MDNVDDLDHYVERLMGSHDQLYAYIYSMTGRVDQAEDILQETNRKLWKRRLSYDNTRDFLPWAYKEAYNQVRAARTKIKRERLVFQDEEVLRSIAEIQLDEIQPIADRALALENCLTKLPEKQRSMIDKYYTSGYSMEEVGETIGRTANSVAVTLHRIRLALADCIRGNMT